VLLLLVKKIVFEKYRQTLSTAAEFDKITPSNSHVCKSIMVWSRQLVISAEIYFV
jgi:hypothetical protein